MQEETYMLEETNEKLLSTQQFGAFSYNFKTDRDAYEQSKGIIVGVPYDGTASYQSGAKAGPAAILNASVNIEPYDAELGDISSLGIYTAGMINVEEIHVVPLKVINTIYEVCKKINGDDKFLITLGGEHSITQGVVRSLKEKYKKLSVLQFDAHLDLMNQFGGSKYSHASVSRRIVDDLKCKVTSFGIRVVSKEEQDYLRKSKNNISVFYARDIYDNDDWHEDAINTLEDNVYISLDLDGFDVSIMPATGTPVPGGLGWYRTLNFLRKVYERRNVVGADVVELKPNPGNEAPNFLAANLVYKNFGFYKKYVLSR